EATYDHPQDEPASWRRQSIRWFTFASRHSVRMKRSTSTRPGHSDRPPPPGRRLPAPALTARTSNHSFDASARTPNPTSAHAQELLDCESLHRRDSPDG